MSISELSSAPEYLSTHQLASILGVTSDALEQLRRRGGSPPFIRISQRLIRYRRSDVEAWFDARVNLPARRGAAGGAS